MNLIFLRHGEATDNVKELISDKEIYWSILTEKGKQTVKESLQDLPHIIDKMYVSPFPRTIETAHYVYEKYPNINVIIENRIREIYYGKYSHQKNNEELDNKKWIIEKGLFIKSKKERSSIDCLYLIDANRDKLTDNYFAYLTHLFVDEYDIIQCFGGKFYEDYQTFYNLYFDSSINKSQIIKECIEAVLELRNIGVNYTDIHSKNIIVNGESHMRLVDLDETRILKPWDDSRVFYFIDLMLESMLFSDVKHSIWHWLTKRSVLMELETKKVLSSTFLDFVSGKNDFDSFYSNVDKYLLELSDKEKSFILRKELKNKYPKWFVS